MSLRDLEARYLPDDNAYYARFYPLLFLVLSFSFILILVAAGAIWYAIYHKPQSPYFAVQQNGERREIYGSREPNLLPQTIIRFATQAAVRAYNFAPVGNVDNLRSVRFYFTESGWNNYIESITPVVNQVETNKLFAYGIVNGAPVIANQGELPDLGYTWRVQIPFLVTFRSAEQTVQQFYILFITIVRVPTYINPQGIGIEQFVMVNPNATI